MYMSQDEYLLAEVLKLYPPPKLVFRRPKQEKFRGGNCCFCSKIWKKPGKNCACFSGTKFCHADPDSREHQTILSDLSDHARSIATIGYPKIRWRFFLFLPNFWFEHRQKKVFVSDPRSDSHNLPLHPRRSPHIAGQSRPGGHFSRDKRWPQFCKFLGRRACIRNILQLGTYSMRI